MRTKLTATLTLTANGAPHTTNAVSCAHAMMQNRRHLHSFVTVRIMRVAYQRVWCRSGRQSSPRHTQPTCPSAPARHKPQLSHRSVQQPRANVSHVISNHATGFNTNWRRVVMTQPMLCIADACHCNTTTMKSDIRLNKSEALMIFYIQSQ